MVQYSRGERMNIIIQEAFGIVASVLVLAGFTVNDIRLIRTISICASVVFIIYGFMLGAFSIIFMNFAVIAVHVYKLIKLKKTKSETAEAN